MRRQVLGIGAMCLVGAGCAQLLGIDAADEVPAPADGGGDTTQGSDGTTNDVTSGDGSRDGTTSDAGLGDAMGTDSSDGGATDANPSGDGASDATDGCAALLAQMLGAPVVPPASWAGLDLSNGGASNDVPGSGGLSLAQAHVLSCASWAEPAKLAPDASPIFAGYRATGFGVADGGPSTTYPLELFTNLQTGSIEQVFIQNGYTGTFQFSSRAGGAYGSHTYRIAVGATSNDGGPVGAGGGYVKRDGIDFPANWTVGHDDAGVATSNAWINELYDGIMATYAPGTPAIGDCRSVPSVFTNYVDGLDFHAPASCLVAPSSGGVAYFGVRPIALYFQFTPGTNQTVGMYNFWLGSIANCNQSTTAELERMDYAPIDWGTNDLTLGGINASEYASNPSGLTPTEVNTIACDPTVVTSPDNGYTATEFGQSGEVEVEFGIDSGIIYKTRARAGYKGVLGTAFTSNGSPPTDVFTGGIGAPLLDNGVPYTLTWGSDAGLVSTSVTTLANALCGGTESDCVPAGDCAITRDGQGRTVVSLLCGNTIPLVDFVFTQGSSDPAEIVTYNPGGQ